MAFQAQDTSRNKAVDIFRQFGIPSLAVIEAIATKGRSPGTAAFKAEQVFQQADVRKRRAAQDALKEFAFGQQGELRQAQTAQIQSKISGQKAQQARLANVRKELEGIDDPADRLDILDAFVAEQDPGKERDLLRKIMQAKEKTEAETLERAGQSEDNLRKELTRVSGEFKSVAAAFDRVQASASDPSAAGDLSLIFAYMKMLDPGSVVRESEQASAANARGVPAAVRNLWNRLLTGERLEVGQRKDFTDRAFKLMNKEQIKNDRLVGKFRSIAEKRGLDFENIFLPLGPVSTIQDVGGIVPSPAKQAPVQMTPQQKRTRLEELRRKEAQ